MQAVNSADLLFVPTSSHENTFVGEFYFIDSHITALRLVKLMSHYHISNIIDHDLTIGKSNSHYQSVWMQLKRGDLRLEIHL